MKAALARSQSQYQVAGFSSDMCVKNFVHGDLFYYFLTIKFLSGHSYPFTFLMFLNFYHNYGQEPGNNYNHILTK